MRPEAGGPKLIPQLLNVNGRGVVDRRRRSWLAQIGVMLKPKKAKNSRFLHDTNFHRHNQFSNTGYLVDYNCFVYSIDYSSAINDW